MKTSISFTSFHSFLPSFFFPSFFLSFLFSFFLSFFLSLFFILSPANTHITQRLYTACHYNTYQMTVLLPNIFLFWIGMENKLQLVSCGHENCQLLSSRTVCMLGHWLLGLLLNFSMCDTNRQATPSLLYAWNFESRSSTICILYLLGIEDQFGEIKDTLAHV